jgi:hypothetical protein
MEEEVKVKLPRLNAEMVRSLGWSWPLGNLSDEEKFSFCQAYARAAVLAERERVRALVLDDAWSLTFQSFGQYRTALAAAIRKGN